MKKILLAGAAVLAGLGAFGTAGAQTRSEGANDAAGDATTAGRINPGDTMSGAVNPAGDKDWFRIRLQEGRTYTFTLTGVGEDGALGDPYLELWAAGGDAPLAENDDAEGLNSALTFTPTESGNYFLAARGFSEEDVGAYTLTTTRPAVAQPPQRLNPGETAAGTIDPTGEHDRYRVRLESGKTYRIALTSSGDPALSDPYLMLFAPGAGAEPTAQDDDGGGNLNSYIEYTAATTGEHTIEARSFGDQGSGAYTLSIREGEIPGDATTDVSLNADGDSRMDRLQPGGDTDWFKVDLAADQTIRVRLNGNEGAGEAALGDPLVRIHGADGAALAEDDDGGDGLNSYLEFTAPTAGSYFIEAAGFLEGAGAYVLDVQSGEIPGSADSTETIGLNDEGRTSRISPAGDVDWYGVSMVEGRTYRINVDAGSADGDLADPMLKLMSPDGSELVVDDDGGTDTGAYISFIAPTAGLYYVAVSAFEDGAGMYRVRVSDNEVPGNEGTDENLTGDDDRVGRIDFPGDKDAFRINAEPGVSYSVAVTSAGDHGVGDPAVAILNANGEQIAANENISRSNRNARISFAAPDDVPVYAVVTGADGKVGDYTIVVSRNAAPE